MHTFYNPSILRFGCSQVCRLCETLTRLILRDFFTSQFNPQMFTCDPGVPHLLFNVFWLVRGVNGCCSLSVCSEIDAVWISFSAILLKDATCALSIWLKSAAQTFYSFFDMSEFVCQSLTVKLCLLFQILRRTQTSPVCVGSGWLKCACDENVGVNDFFFYTHWGVSVWEDAGSSTSGITAPAAELLVCGGVGLPIQTAPGPGCDSARHCVNQW